MVFECMGYIHTDISLYIFIHVSRFRETGVLPDV